MIFKQFKIKFVFTLFITLILNSGLAVSQTNNKLNYYSLIDSADLYIDNNPKVSEQF